MFDLIASGVQAYNQIGMLIAAAICLGLGGLLLGNGMIWRLGALHVRGTIIGVIARNGMYAPVYRYATPTGETREAKSDVSLGWLKGYQTGRVVRLLVSRHNPARARKANFVGLEIVGIICLVPGFLFARAALAYSITPMTALVGVGLLLILGERAYRALRNDPMPSLGQWRRRLTLDDGAPINLAEVKPAEEITAGAVSGDGPKPNFQNSNAARLLLGAAGVILVIFGVYQGARIVRLEMTGERAAGEVVRLVEEESSSDDGGSVYYPVVRYHTASGIAVEFKDSIGTNPPAYRGGEHVGVLYSGTEAIIDRGVLNAAAPVLLFGFGAALVGVAFVLHRGARQTAAAPLPRKDRLPATG